MESAEEKTDYSQEIDNPYRYAGYEYLDSVDLYDLNARYYNPKTARFLSEDPYFNLGNRVIGLYEINVPNVLSIMQANALFHDRCQKHIYTILCPACSKCRLRRTSRRLRAFSDW